VRSPRIALAIVVVTLVGALLWQRPPATTTIIDLEVDVRARIGRVRPIWDETNLWKLHSMFGASHADPARWWGPGWMRRHAPWIRYARLLAALGGNYAPAIAPWCDHGSAAPEHPDTQTQECGKDGVPGSAARDELVREVEGATVVDYTPFRVAVERVLRSGVRPHLNLSAAPAAFTGGSTDFTHYHWNAAPIQDYAGWSAFVTGAFRAVADLHPERWRVSITNEPNCLTLVGWLGDVRHVGFAGTPEDYARTFVTSARAIRSVAPGIALHAGNYVTSTTFPGEDNLLTYLRFLRDAFAADGEQRWDDLAAMSLSLYETRDTSLYDLVPVRVARLERAARDAGLAPLPIRVDELDVHPTISDAFEATTHQRLDRTAFAASWHAEAIRELVDTGRVIAVAPWLSRMFDLATFAPYPKARAYQLLGLLAGQLRTIPGMNDIEVRRTPRRHGLPRLAVTGDQPPNLERLRDMSRPASSLRTLATRTPHGFRLLVVHHQARPVSDGSGLRRQLARRIRIHARHVAAGAYQVRVASLGSVGATWDGKTTPLGWRDGGCHLARDGSVEIAATTLVDANTVWLFDATRRLSCPMKRTHSVQATD
jgi:hypothetical protein